MAADPNAFHVDVGPERGAAHQRHPLRSGHGAQTLDELTLEGGGLFG